MATARSIDCMVAVDRFRPADNGSDLSLWLSSIKFVAYYETVFHKLDNYDYKPLSTLCQSAFPSEEIFFKGEVGEEFDSGSSDEHLLFQPDVFADDFMAGARPAAR